MQCRCTRNLCAVCRNGTGHVLTIGCHMHDRDLAACCLHCVYVRSALCHCFSEFITFIYIHVERIYRISKHYVCVVGGAKHGLVLALSMIFKDMYILLACFSSPQPFMVFGFSSSITHIEDLHVD